MKANDTRLRLGCAEAYTMRRVFCVDLQSEDFLTCGVVNG